ncbi:hypothetical protein K2173_013881 [Erythroxylum novogranatense]|uniref:RIN4 pathogenic type III effector avirulence factor Avr cleavage site domain-containing protein n=1 Tax=Erythroxylum novogranatense TaxID=1862640 RepID=A0AAV8SCL8_9ROSI|nr:hypothetical protein K2173_013881 [Erythroxylum novogranatense]
MAQQDKGRPLPKFGEWDVTNPASAEGYTVIFSKARDDKKPNGAGGVGSVSQNNTSKQQNSDYPPTKKRFCCF